MDELQGRQKIEILFSLLLVAAAFMPILKVPLLGGVSAFDLGWPGYVIAGLGVVALVGAFIDSRWIPPLCAAATLVLTAGMLVYFIHQMSRAGMEIDRDLKGNPFKGLAKAFVGAISLTWGWFGLLAGCVGVGIAQTLAELFLGSGLGRREDRHVVRIEPTFGPTPQPGRRAREPFLVREPRRTGTHGL